MPVPFHSRASIRAPSTHQDLGLLQLVLAGLAGAVGAGQGAGAPRRAATRILHAKHDAAGSIASGHEDHAVVSQLGHCGGERSCGQAKASAWPLLR